MLKEKSGNSEGIKALERLASLLPKIEKIDATLGAPEATEAGPEGFSPDAPLKALRLCALAETQLSVAEKLLK
jgi:hypothetical protein